MTNLPTRFQDGSSDIGPGAPGHSRLMRRVRTVRSFLQGVGARLDRSTAPVTAASVAQLREAAQLADQANTLLESDPDSAAAIGTLLDRALVIGRKVDRDIDPMTLEVPEWDTGIGPGPAFQEEDWFSELLNALGNSYGGDC
ncbi:hypothetical protein [Janibacter indicus]|uniref:Uncharacterized protein n=1 Tax=Janibacter indicus TaxID=857417 RepID=A0A1W1ZHY7_9MICO|nr:hypothetical protein [Janibacter indicus]SMC48175.1 hypothetical protein SAMN06296429_10417 [Janibacter indicus]